MIPKLIKIPIIILLALHLVSVNCKKKPSILTFKTFNSTFAPSFLEYCETSIPPEFHGQAFTIDAVLIRNITNNLFARIGVLLYNSEKDTFTQIFQYDFDVCRLWDGFMSKAIARTWYNNIKKYGNFPATCPIYTGHYFIKKMKIDKNSVPPFMLDGIYRSKTKLLLKHNGEEEELFDSVLDLEVKRN